MQQLVRATRTELETLYASNADAENKRAAKREILDRLSADAQALIDADGRGLRNWLAPPLNNARLVSMNLYEGQVGAFRAIYEKCDRSLECFYARAAELGDMSYESRNLVMRAAAD